MQKKQIKDNIYNLIEVNDIAEKILKTNEFQRLRDIKQLGIAYKAFGGANHTRYEHSLGVYHLGQEVMRLHNSKGEIASTMEEREFLMACLLHDIGHGPLSHTSEDFYNFNHEKIGVEVLKAKNGEIGKILREKRLLQGVCAIIKKEHPNGILNKLLSSGLDVDRMDYLNRDSFYTNFTYGKINTKDIIENMKFNSSLEYIYFDSNKKLMAENFILSRYYMFSEVYLNSDIRIYECILKYILSSIKNENVNVLTMNVEKLLNMNDSTFLQMIKSEVSKSEDENVKFLWDIYTRCAIDELEFTKDKEKADLIIPSITKNIIDDKNTCFILEDGKYKKIQTAQGNLLTFEITQEGLYIKLPKKIDKKL